MFSSIAVEEAQAPLCSASGVDYDVDEAQKWWDEIVQAKQKKKQKRA